MPTFVDYVAEADAKAVLDYVNNEAPPPNRYMFDPSFPTLPFRTRPLSGKLSTQVYPAATSSWAMTDSIPRKAKRVIASTQTTVHGGGKSRKLDTALATESGMQTGPAIYQMDAEFSALPENPTRLDLDSVSVGSGQHDLSATHSMTRSSEHIALGAGARSTSRRGGKRRASRAGTELNTDRLIGRAAGRTVLSTELGNNEPASKRRHEIVTVTPLELLDDDSLLRGKMVGAISGSSLEEVAKVQEAAVSFEVSTRLQLRGSSVSVKAVIDTANRAKHPLINAT